MEKAAEQQLAQRGRRTFAKDNRGVAAAVASSACSTTLKSQGDLGSLEAFQQCAQTMLSMTTE